MTTESDWDALRAGMVRLLADARAQIRSYPPPIPACDAQFNHLLELRDRLPAEIARLDACRQGLPGGVAAFIAGSPCADALRPLLVEREGA